MTDGAVIAGLTAPAQVVVTGASSGIGLAATRALLADAGVAQVFALSRTAETSDALAGEAAIHGARLRRIAVDLAEADAIASAVARVAGETEAVHLLFNAAGVLHAPGLRPEKSLADVSADALRRVFALNTFAPLLLAQALRPLLPKAQPAVLASLSARVGSIGDNRLGGWYAYRASKAAQNQLWRTLAVELARSHPRACCVLLHPGTVDSALSKPFQARVPRDRLFTPERAAAQLLAIVARMMPVDSGRFLAWDGSEVPW